MHCVAPCYITKNIIEQPRIANTQKPLKMAAEYKGGKVFSWVWWRVHTSGARAGGEDVGLDTTLIPGHIMPHEWSTMLL